jgi:dTDP-3-amino-2,3,6-trideoxy-4-keto-D-glucose/dTDP-3-amino-3,4,6-trideoxy-alpha-D-glucose/dTDP-2,6-dideoxy-D-kanosamine transaminase
MSSVIWRCDLVPQYEAYSEEIDAAIKSVLGSGRYVLAENVAAFEAEFAAYVGSPHAVGVNSGTDALILALVAAGVGPGDEVITTPFTAIPTYSAIRHTGASPIFADIDPETMLMDLGAVERALTPRTRAVVAVHLFGNALDVEALRLVVGPGVFILEDCAQSHGAAVRGRRTGTLGDAAAFSFYPTKNLGAYGDGGLVTTGDAGLADDVRRRRMYGMTSKDAFMFDGINSRLDELQAAILRVKLRHLDAMNARRRELAAVYAALLPAEVRPQAVRAGVESVCHVYAALCEDRRDDLVVALGEDGIQTNVYYPMPLCRQEAYRRAFNDAPPVPVTEVICARVIALPLYPEMPEATAELVARAITRFYRGS